MVLVVEEWALFVPCVVARSFSCWRFVHISPLQNGWQTFRFDMSARLSRLAASHLVVFYRGSKFSMVGIIDVNCCDVCPLGCLLRRIMFRNRVREPLRVIVVRLKFF